MKESLKFSPLVMLALVPVISTQVLVTPVVCQRLSLEATMLVKLMLSRDPVVTLRLPLSTSGVVKLAPMFVVLLNRLQR